MTDYQATKLLVEQHRQQCAASGGAGRGAPQRCAARGANVAEEEESGEALSAFTGKSGGASRQGGKNGNGKSNVICGRCGERGHIKKDCTKKCGECGLKSCGGVKGRCMTKGGIPEGLAKIMQPEIKAMIVKRAKEMGAAWVKGQAEAHLFEEQDDADGDPRFDPSVDSLEELFDLSMGGEVNICAAEVEGDPSAAATYQALYGDCCVPGFEAEEQTEADEDVRRRRGLRGDGRTHRPARRAGTRPARRAGRSPGARRVGDVRALHRARARVRDGGDRVHERPERQGEEAEAHVRRWAPN